MSPTKTMQRQLLLGMALGLGVAVLATAAPAHATYYQVPASAPDGFTDGKCSLREAILAANTRKQVDTCPPGEWWNEIEIQGQATTLNLTRNETIEITCSLDIYGQSQPGYRQAIYGKYTPFVVRPGGELYLASLRLSNFDVTPITVQGGVVSGYGFKRGLLSLSSVEISGNDGHDAVNQNASIINDNGAVYIYSSLLKDNRGGIKGGGVLNQYGTLEISSTSITGNSVLQYGGGIHNYQGTVKLFNVLISDNQQTGDEGGGGIYNTGSIDMKWTTITANSATNGGGVNNAGGTVTVKNSIIADNTSGSLGTSDCSGLMTSAGYNVLFHCDDTPKNVATDKRGKSAQLENLTWPDTDHWYRPLYRWPTTLSPAYRAIPAGTNDCGSSYGPDDELGNSRPAPCDIGAAQRQ